MLDAKINEAMEEGWRLLSDDEILDIYDVLEGFEIKQIVDPGEITNSANDEGSL